MLLSKCEAWNRLVPWGRKETVDSPVPTAKRRPRSPALRSAHLHLDSFGVDEGSLSLISELPGVYSNARVSRPRAQ